MVSRIGLEPWLDVGRAVKNLLVRQSGAADVRPQCAINKIVGSVPGYHVDRLEWLHRGVQEGVLPPHIWNRQDSLVVLGIVDAGDGDLPHFGGARDLERV